MRTLLLVRVSVFSFLTYLTVAESSVEVLNFATRPKCLRSCHIGRRRSEVVSFHVHAGVSRGELG
jgi:hypothetical protein